MYEMYEMNKAVINALEHARELASDDAIFSPDQNYMLRMIINQIEITLREATKKGIER